MYHRRPDGGFHDPRKGPNPIEAAMICLEEKFKWQYAYIDQDHVTSIRFRIPYGKDLMGVFTYRSQGSQIDLTPIAVLDVELHHLVHEPQRTDFEEVVDELNTALRFPKKGRFIYEGRSGGKPEHGSVRHLALMSRALPEDFRSMEFEERAGLLVKKANSMIHVTSEAVRTYSRNHNQPR